MIFKFRPTFSSIFIVCCFCFSLFFSVCFAGSSAQLTAVPHLKSRVNDLADVLNKSTIQILEEHLKLLEDSDSTQIVVLIVKSLNGESIESFSLRVAESWKIGQKNADNGALLVVSLADRLVRIEVGYGLEGQLTDLVCGRIIRHEIVPAFRNNDFSKGVLNGVSAMISVVKGTYNLTDAEKSDKEREGAVAFVCLSWFLGQLGRLFRSRVWKVLTASAFGSLGGILIGAVYFPSVDILTKAALGALCGLVALVFKIEDIGSLINSGRTYGGGGGRFGGGGASGRW